MKRGIIILILAAGFTAQGQSLKDALYGGKLKNQAGTVIRKSDDLSTKMDTTTKTDTLQKIASKDSARTRPAAPPTAVKMTSDSTMTNGGTATQHADTLAQAAMEESAPAVGEPVAAAPVKDNNALWKEYINGMLPSFNTEMLPNKKVKRGSYSVMVSYSIDTDGETAVTDVFVAPENDFIKEQVKTRLMDSPKLSPVLNSAGAARKVTKRYSFTLTKE
jgi:hypothetical protein